MKQLFVFLGALVLLAGLLSEPAQAAPGKEKWDNILSEAKKEGKVTIYGQVGPELRIALTKALKDDLGIDMNLIPGAGNEVATKFRTELQAGLPSADILLGGSGTFLSVPELYAAWDRLEPELVLPEVLDTKAWPEGKLPFTDSQKRMIPLTLQMNQTIVVNTDIVKPGQIKSYQDLLHPQWKGKIGMSDPTRAGASQTWAGLILTKIFGAVEGEAYFRKLAAQEPMLTREARIQAEWVARGRYPVSIGVTSQSSYDMQKNGAPIARLAAEEGGLLTGGGSYLVISKKRPHPQATAAVLNWLLTARGQAVYSKGYGAPASRLGIKTEGVSANAFPLPGEKTYIQTAEEMIAGHEIAAAAAKRVFRPLQK